MTSSSRVALITDSMCDIPASLMAQYDIRFVPMYLIWGTREYRDRIDIQPEEFYARLGSDPEHPKSSQTHLQDYLNLLEQAQQAGATEAVIISFSGHMSASLNVARQAASQSPLPVHVYDSRSGGMGQGWQVLAAARAREAGGDAEAMLAAAGRVRQTLHFFFFVDQLEYLYRGGRIDGLSNLIGTLLHLKPVLYVNHAVGRIEAAEKIRTRSRAVERVYQTFFDQVDTSRPLHICVAHSNAPALADEVAARIQSEYQPVELLTTLIGPVMGTHIGPGALGIVGYSE